MSIVKDIEIIKMAVEEWIKGELTSAEAMRNISTYLSIRPPTPECVEWAKQAIEANAEK